MSSLGVEQFQSLRLIVPYDHLSQLDESFNFFKVRQNHRKYCNKQQNKQTTFFLPKINKAFLNPILQNVNGRSALETFFK